MKDHHQNQKTKEKGAGSGKRKSVAVPTDSSEGRRASHSVHRGGDDASGSHRRSSHVPSEREMTDGKKKGRKGKMSTPAIKKMASGVETEVIEPISDEVLRKFQTCKDCHEKQAKTAILLLQSPETDLVLESLSCLEKYCKKDEANVATFIDLKGIEEAGKLAAKSDNLVLQRLALKLLAVVSPNPAAAAHFKEINMIQDFLGLLASTDPIMVEYATYILANLAKNPELREEISPVIHTLVELLHHPDPDIQKNSAEAILSLLDDPNNIDALLDKQYLKPILKLVSSEHSVIQGIGIHILRKVTTKEEGINVLEEMDAHKPLGKKLKSRDSQLYQPIIQTLTNMCSSPTALLKIVSLTPTIAKLLDTKDVALKCDVLKLLGILSSVPEGATMLVDLGVSKRLVKMLTEHGHDEHGHRPSMVMDKEADCIIENVVFCISQLAKTDFRAKEELTEAIAPLVSLMENKDTTDATFEHILSALANIVDCGVDSTCSAFLKSGAIDKFHHMLDNVADYSQPKMLKLMECLCQITPFCELRSEFVEAGIIESTLKAAKQSTDPQFLVACANTIRGLLCTAEGRKRFLDHNGYDFLVDMMSHPDMTVVFAVAPLLHILATYPEITKMLIEKGILQSMWKRQDLVLKNGPLKSAFDRLTSSYLPIKFAISGHLDPYERLKDGFYDIGGLKVGEDFMTIDQINWDNWDPKRQILYLNWDGSSNSAESPAFVQNESLQVMNAENLKCEDIVTILKRGLSKPYKERDLVTAIAKAVSDRNGGMLDKRMANVYHEEAELADIQLKYKSIVVPLSMINSGGFRSRAFLFKAVCDAFFIPCSLERGEYGRMWNVVLLHTKEAHLIPECGEPIEDKAPKNPEEKENLRRFVVDLVYEPGTLLPVNSIEANTYCCI